MSMMFKHTSGPWKLSKTKVGVPAVFPADARTSMICALYTGQTDDHTLCRNHEANGQLIAASPDMLAALRAIVSQALQGKVLPRDACVAQALAAIAKAEGRA